MNNIFTPQFLQSIRKNPFRTTVSQQAHQSYSSNQLNILCQGYGTDGSEAAKFIFKIIKNSLYYLLGDVNDQKCEFQEINKRMLGNLLESCFQQLRAQKINGTVSFIFSCIWQSKQQQKTQKKLTVMKNNGLQCYLVKQNALIPIKSHSLPFKIQKKQMSTRGFIDSQTRFKPYMLENGDVEFLEYPLNLDEDRFILLGSSCVFNNFQPQQFLQYFKEACKNQKQDLMAIGAQIIKEAKKRWRTIYQEDMSLIIARL